MNYVNERGVENKSERGVYLPLPANQIKLRLFILLIPSEVKCVTNLRHSLKCVPSRDFLTNLTKLIHKVKRAPHDVILFKELHFVPPPQRKKKQMGGGEGGRRNISRAFKCFVCIFCIILLNLSLTPNSPFLISLNKTKLSSTSLSCCIELQGYLERLFSFSILKFYTWKSKHQSHGISK